MFRVTTEYVGSSSPAHHTKITSSLSDETLNRRSRLTVLYIEHVEEPGVT